MNNGQGKKNLYKIIKPFKQFISSLKLTCLNKQNNVINKFNSPIYLYEVHKKSQPNYLNQSYNYNGKNPSKQGTIIKQLGYVSCFM